MDSQDIFCSSCRRSRAVDEFHVNKQGKRNKTCQRHSKKRPLEVDDWENFIQVLRNWNEPNQSEILDGTYTFALDALPVNFRSLRVQENAFPRSELNTTMRDLIDIIRDEGGFRFTHLATNGAGSSYTYRCCQDVMSIKKYESTLEPEKRRDGKRMDRVPCESRLRIGPCLQSRTLSLSIHYRWHTPYEDNHVPPIVLELINERGSSKTSSEILRDIRAVPEAKNVTRHQVYYLWKKANAEIRQPDSDPFASATMLLSEDSNSQNQ
ncbi:uncharacterized protein N7515_001333 [Penicillium bovifimosum]|uniref:Uncharacterized protein n=1 Tax=Penicillium bovifimosum TaxID=126998 RepID=A0A9W9L899_9EURO|nr:uncharacterized protein N7515_001333 [Penicillium bovifimosum]KAJ5142546.1 hypothetical protein N7515_001333 [Penicillium bovifimosum]